MKMAAKQKFKIGDKVQLTTNTTKFFKGTKGVVIDVYDYVDEPVFLDSHGKRTTRKVYVVAVSFIKATTSIENFHAFSYDLKRVR
ncbi:MAG: hypothetical protein PHW73_04120 [Atribacterota bacterium]|nr:hypothetical protein [Atribacterota bacterium]